MKNLTRRDFIRLCGTSSIGLAIAACGVTPTATVVPAATNTPLPPIATLPTITRTLMNPATGTVVLTPTPAPTSPAAITRTATPPPVTLRDWAKKKGVPIALLVAWGSFRRYPLFKELVAKVGTNAYSFNEARTYRIFKGLDWDKVLRNWDAAINDLARGVIPFEKEIDPEGWHQRVRDIKSECTSMGIEFDGYLPILGGPDILPDGLLKSSYASDDIMRILEFVTKVKVLLFKDATSRWHLPEMIGSSSLLWPSNPTSTFWYTGVAGGKRVTIDVIEKVVFNVARWIQEAVPGTTFALYEESLLHPSDNDVYSRVLTNFNTILGDIKATGVPVHEVGNENTFWVYAPPKPAEMLDILQRFKSMGFGIAPSQTVVAMSKKFPLWSARPITAKDPNYVSSYTDEVQAQIYVDTLQVYVEAGAPFGIYGVFPESPDTFPENIEPSANSHPFRADGTPNLAYDSLIKYLQQLPDK